LFINNGLLRKNEYEEVLERFKKDLNLNVRGVDASKLFLSLSRK
jgi:GMP synthase (glutamine-hydrolysing)